MRTETEPPSSYDPASSIAPLRLRQQIERRPKDAPAAIKPETPHRDDGSFGQVVPLDRAGDGHERFHGAR